MSTPASAGPTKLLEGRDEPIVEPELPIVDAHHHFYDTPTTRYLFDDLSADVGAGHKVTATVYVSTQTMMRAAGPEALRPLGEVEWANGLAAQSASGQYGATRICAGIIGFADLRTGAEIGPLLDRCQATAPDRFRGIRQSALEPPTADAFRFSISTAAPTAALLSSPGVRSGLRELAARGLSFDTSVFHHQLADLARIADDIPELTIVVDHMGIAYGLGASSEDRAAAFDAWRSALTELSQRPNVVCKIGGLGMPFWGFGFETRTDPVGSQELAVAWRPYVESAVSAFGPDRSMMESNYPPDGRSAGYVPIWNAYKRILKDYSPAEKAAVFSGTATRVYRLS